MSCIIHFSCFGGEIFQKRFGMITFSLSHACKFRTCYKFITLKVRCNHFFFNMNCENRKGRERFWPQQTSSVVTLETVPPTISIITEKLDGQLSLVQGIGFQVPLSHVTFLSSSLSSICNSYTQIEVSASLNLWSKENYLFYHWKQIILCIERGLIHFGKFVTNQKNFKNYLCNFD